MKSFLHLFIFCLFSLITGAQDLSQVIRGKVVDKASLAPLPGASVVIPGSEPFLGSSTDNNGEFVIKSVPVGRHTVRITFIGYEEVILDGLLIGSAKETILNVEMKETISTMKEVVVKADKTKPINAMTTVSARQISMEEASRYAGGFNDPARLATAFAGVAGDLGDNGIVIRGNAPKGLLWRMEGVPISNPSHFANVSSLGAGAITALSDKVMANSDFLTGAFPAEYGNALSGVFDIRLRSGNNERREYAFQLGLAGIEAALEGPFIKGRQSSYLLNYRYSIFDLLAPILPPEMGRLRYHDLSFKFSFPTKKAGTFSLWGIGAKDFQGRDAIPDSAKWESDTDKQQYRSDLFMVGAGFGHKIFANRNTYINTTLSVAGNGIELNQQMYDPALELLPYKEVRNKTWDFSLTSFVNHKFGSRHTNRTGLSISRMQYDWFIRDADSTGKGMITYADDRGSSFVLQAYSQSRLELTGNLSLILGLHSQYFALNNRITLEPRAGINWEIGARHTLGFSYGLHSQLELLNFYLAEVPCSSGYTQANKDLGFSKAHHFVLSYKFRFSLHTHLKIEPYYQWLYEIPVEPGSWYSLQNLESGIFFNDSLVNKGKGRNLGIDITLERLLHRGFYYLVTASVFDSRYCGGDNIWRNARFNKNYVVNLLAGKEWKTGKKRNNLFNINFKLTLMGGDFMNPIDEAATYASQEIVEDVSKAFTVRKPAAYILSMAMNYRINKRKHASIWEFSFINILGYKELNGYYFDKTTNSIKEDVNQLVVPNLSYRIEF